MTDLGPMLFPRTIQEEIERLEADIADGAFPTAEGLAHANCALSGLRTALWLSEMAPENDDFPENIREIMERLLEELPRIDEPPADMVWSK